MTHLDADIPSARKRFRFYLPLWLVLVWIVVIGGVGFYTHYHHPELWLPLKQKTGQLLGTPKTSPPNVSTVAVPIEVPVEVPPAKPMTLEDEFSNTAMEASISAVMDRTLQLEQEIAETNQRLQQAQRQVQVTPLIIAVVHLRDAIQATNPYVEELAILRSLTPNDMTIQGYIATLDERAGSGVRNLPQLRQQFEEIEHRVAVATRQVPPSASIWEKIKANLAQAIIIRKVGKAAIAEGNTTDAALAAIKRALQDNNLSAAVTKAQQLSEPALVVLQSWLQEAEATLKIHQTNKALYDYMMTMASQQVKIDNVQVIEETP